MELYNLVSLAGIFILLFLAWLFSKNRKCLNWNLIFWAIGLQFLLAFFIFIFPPGVKLFLLINDAVVAILVSAAEGAKFVFGPLAIPAGEKGSLGFILAFQAFPTIIFFSALVSILYFYNIMPWLIKVFANAFTRLMKISGAESLCAASNIFVGVESAITIRPHLNELTKSELCTVLSAGMATVASNVLAFYVFLLHKQFPTIAGHLISASLLSAPAALVMSKLLLPEEDDPKTLGQSIAPYYERDNNLFEAVINGSQTGVRVIVGVVALLIAVLGLVALGDTILGGIGAKLNTIFSTSIDWSFKGLLGYLFYPISFIIGIPPSDVGTAAQIIGERVVLTEVVSYQDLARVMSENVLHHSRSSVIIAYALCGFAHVASMAIFVGGISALAPKKTTVLSKVAFRALCAATLACLMTACIAGTFYCRSSILLGGG